MRKGKEGSLAGGGGGAPAGAVVRTDMDEDFGGVAGTAVGGGAGGGPNSRPRLPCVSTRGWYASEMAVFGRAVASHEDRGRALGISCCAVASRSKTLGV